MKAESNWQLEEGKADTSGAQEPTVGAPQASTGLAECVEDSAKPEDTGTKDHAS